MKCPLCNFSDSRVLDSRPIDEGSSIKRRRECISCGKRFTTYEVVNIVPIYVVKRNGEREFFDKMTLGQAFRATSKIYTNDNGLQFIDTLIDGNGRPLLAPSPVEPMKMVLGCGPTTVEIVVLPNSDFPNLEQGIPFIVGDLDEGVALFDRRRVTLMQSKTASVEGYNAFEQGGLLIRADERADYVVRDAAAFVLGYIAAV